MNEPRDIRLPALSAQMEEAVLLEWRVAAGDHVEQGQPLAEISTDKVDMDLEAPFSGTIHELVASEGDTIPVGGVLATAIPDEEDLLGGLSLGDEPAADTASAPEDRPADDASFGTAPPAEPETTPTGIVAASPAARALARRLGVDLAGITPTGKRGQVTPEDVRAAAERSQEATAPAASPARAAAPAPEPAPAPQGVDDARRQAVRRATAEIMERSAAVPQFTLYRQLVLDRAAEKRGGRSWTTEVVRAMAEALRSHPELNVRWDAETRTAVAIDGVSVGLAVDRPGVGLVVATIADPDLLAPDEADAAIRALVDRARTGKLRPEDMAPASITLSNLGGLGIDRFNALLVPPQAVILSMGTVRPRPVVTGDGGLRAALTCEVGLTVDHRVADGADGARYLDSLAAIVEARR